MGPPRNYYADLELPTTADVQDIKKQFRKLALKYHPDRNPGREREVNAKFQVIQTAHELLTDPQEKAKVDAALNRSTGYQGASGVKGNPWSHVGQQFPTPPQRTQSPRNGASGGAQRWQQFSRGVPPTAKQYHTSAESEAKKNAAKAFEGMRKGQHQSSRSQRDLRQPPPPPPRNESAKQRAEASFGNRKPSYPSREPAFGQDSSTRDRKYHSRSSHARTEDEIPGSLHTADTTIPDPLRSFRDAYDSDGRQRTPYSSQGGEKTNPFDGVRINRAKSSRETDYMPDRSSSQRNVKRSSSVPRWATAQGSESHSEVPAANQETSSANEPADSSSKPSFKARAEAAQFSQKPSSNLDGGHQQQPNFAANGTAESARSHDSQERTIFNLPIDDDTFTRTSSDDPNRATPSLADNINTKFAEGQGSSAWRFNAGTDGSAEPVRRHSGSTTLSGQGSSADAQPSQRASKSNPDLQSVKSEGSFNADGWSDKFGPQTFAPRQESASFSSSATANRANLRKSKPAKPTAGPAAVIEDSSDDDVYEWAGRKGQARAATVESPQAMDIDPPTSSETPNEGIPSSNGARNIPVEPSRPEWRSGDLERSNASKGIEHKDRNQFDPNTAGSEDSEEFRTSFADLKNVEPFSQQNQGLKSLSDLKDNLPFESKASGETPVKMPKPPTLVFPEPPQAPRLPPTVAISGMKPNAPSWNKYLQEFMDYLQRWDTFNADVVDHFSTRKANINEQRKERGYSFLGLRSDSDVQEYYNWIQQDNEVRRRWLEACEEHERQYRAFLTFREKMK